MTDDLTLPPSDGPDAELLGLIDRLAELLDRSDLTEIEVESGATGLILRKPVGPIAVPDGVPCRDGRPAGRGGRSARRRPRPSAERSVRRRVRRSRRR